MVLALGVGTPRHARRRHRGHGRCVGHACLRARQQFERQRRDVAVESGARLADVSGYDGCGSGGWRYRCATAGEHVCMRLARGTAAHPARWRYGRRVGHVCRRVLRRLGLRRRVVTAKTGARPVGVTLRHARLC